MKKIFFSLLTCISININAQIIISDDTTVCGSYIDTLQALSALPSSMSIDDQHDVAVPIGFTFNFYGISYTQLVISGNGYITFDASQSSTISPWTINTAIPNPGSMPENAIMAPWHDIDLAVGGTIYYGMTGIAPNRIYTITWCAVPMYSFSCNSLLHTSQIVLYEGSDKIEMFIQDKPICSTHNDGQAIQGLVSANSTNFDIVIDPVTTLPRNYNTPPNSWAATNEGWEFLPNTSLNSYTINSIPYVPIVTGTNTWTDTSGNVLATGPSLPVNISASNLYLASITGACSFGTLTDSLTVTVSTCFGINYTVTDASCSADDGIINIAPDNTLSIWDVSLLDSLGNNIPFYSAVNIVDTFYTFYNLDPGTYIILMQSGNTSVQDTVVLGQIQNLLTFQSNIQESNCLGNDGGITILPDQQYVNYPWDISISNILGDTLQLSSQLDSAYFQFDSLITGDYIVSIVDSGECLFVDTIVLSQVTNNLNMQIHSTNVSCYGGLDGEIGVFLDNGLLPYTFYINGVENTNPPPYDSLFTGLSEGTYIITAIDSDSCGLVETIFIDAPNFPLQVLSSNSITVCDTSIGGSAYAFAAGGTPFSGGSYVFEWYDSNMGSLGISDSILNLGVGDYFLEVTDLNNCQANLPITVSTPQLPLDITNIEIEPVVCTGASTGWITAYAGQGLAPYSYVWSDLSGTILKTTNNITTQDTLSGLPSGTYRLLVTDASGCTQDRTIFIDEDTLLLEISSVAVADSISCYGDLDGSAVVIMTPGSGSTSYNYLWDNGEIGPIATSLSGGVHTVQVTDSRGCVVSGSVDIPESSKIKSYLMITTPISCYGGSDGKISVSTSGGSTLSTTPFYDYFWSNGVGQNLNYIDNLSHGSYSLITRDANGCVVTDSIYLPEPDPLYVNASQILRVSCYGFSDGSAYAVGVGGTLPYEFTWDSGNIIDLSLNDSSITNILSYGLDTVVLQDARGCLATDTVMITEPAELIVTISDSTLAYCIGVNTAAATATVFGGTFPYVYEWDDNILVPQTTATAENLDAGFYMVTVGDDRGCSAQVSVNLSNVTSTMFANIDILSSAGLGVSCYGASDGSLTAQVGGGFSPYAYQWVGPTGTSTNDSIFNLSAGTYSVIITDVNGCTVNTDQELIAPAPLLYKVLSDENTTCLGSCDGQIQLYIDGGTAPYTADLLSYSNVLLSTHNIDSNNYISDICTDIYTVTIKDSYHCDGVLILGGSDQALLDTTITTDVEVSVTQNIDCYGGSTGAITAINPQIVSPFTYEWTDLSGTSVSMGFSAGNLISGDYILYSGYNNIDGCTTTDTILVSQSSLIQSTVIISNASCNGISDGSITVSTSGGVAPYTYSWSSLSSSSNTISNLTAGSYSLSITDANNCSVSESYIVDEPAELQVTVTPTQTYILNASVVGGTSPYTYSWENQNQFGMQVGTGTSYTVGSYGTYYVVVTDENGCEVISGSTNFTEGPLSTLDLNQEINLNIYPNPFQQETTIEFGKKINSAKLRVVDVYGKLIEKHQIFDADKYIIKRNQKSSGVYFIELELDSQKTRSIRLLIK